MLMQVARLWDRTPFFPNSCAPGPGGGVDCVNLMNAIYATCACIPRQRIPSHVMDYGQHADRSLLIEAFETWPDLKARFVRLEDCSPANIIPGDALCFLAGKVPHHGGVMLIADEFIHAYASNEGVHRTQLAAAIRGKKILGRLAAVFRPIP
jgi:cell wall-associated NlpC family hydrolase